MGHTHTASLFFILYPYCLKSETHLTTSLRVFSLNIVMHDVKVSVHETSRQDFKIVLLTTDCCSVFYVL